MQMPSNPAHSPGPGSHSLIYELNSILRRIDLTGLFGNTRPVEVELGSGDGSFLVEYAAQDEARNFIGVERLLGRIRKMDRKARRKGLNNLRGVRIESGYFLERLLPKSSVAAIHVYFPDPWPKRKHARHRLVNERFPAMIHAALEPGGTIYFRTDDGPYFSQITAAFEGSAHFTEIETPASLAALFTDFERDFHAKGVRTLRAAYRAR